MNRTGFYSYTMKPDVVYICDPAKNHSCEKTECFLNGGECMHTNNPRFAKNFKILCQMGGVTYYQEKDDSRK